MLDEKASPLMSHIYVKSLRQKKILDLADRVFTETVFPLQTCRNRNIKYQRDLFFIATWSHLFNSKWVSITKLGRMVE